MSGSKVLTSVGISQVVTGAGIAAVGTAAGVFAVGVIATTAVVSMAGKAVQAYQERKRKQQEAIEQREQDIKQKIAAIRAQIRSRAGQSRVIVKLPSQDISSSQVKLSSTVSVPTTPAQATVAKDDQRRVNELKSRLPKIHSEYQALIDQQVLDSSTVEQAIQQVEGALNENNLGSAEAHLQALDDARILAVQQVRNRWLAQANFLQERLNELSDRLPQAVTLELQNGIDWARNNWQQLSDPDLEAMHQKISVFEAQADQVQIAAENLINSWTQVDYVARVLGIDDGDVVIEVETHEGANTQMRVQFDGQQIGLEGPHDHESNSCAERTIEAMKLFQEQGYQLEWKEWDGEPVTEELRYLYSVPPSDTSETQETLEAPKSQAQIGNYQQPQRRRETQGY